MSNDDGSSLVGNEVSKDAEFRIDAFETAQLLILVMMVEYMRWLMAFARQ